MDKISLSALETRTCTLAEVKQFAQKDSLQAMKEGLAAKPTPSITQNNRQCDLPDFSLQCDRTPLHTEL